MHASLSTHSANRDASMMAMRRLIEGKRPDSDIKNLAKEELELPTVNEQRLS